MPTFRPAVGAYWPLTDPRQWNWSMDALLPGPLAVPSLQFLARSLVLIASCGLQLSAAQHSWFVVPGSTTATEHYEQIESISPSCQFAFQIALVGGLFLWLTTLIILRRKTHLTLIVAVGMLLVTLSFPYFVMHSNPDLAGDATWLHMQHDNLTWLGGDINLDAENGLAAWKSSVYWVDTPRQVTVAPLPTWSAWDLGLDKLDDVLIWLGYSNAYCQFAQAGWFHAVLGSLALVLFTIFSADGISVSRAKFGATLFVAACVTLIAIALSGPFRAKSHLDQSARHLRNGELEESLTQLDRSAELFPVLTQDTYFVAQKAFIEYKLRKPTDYAELHRARQLESSGRYEQAYEVWKKLCDSSVVTVQRESLRSILRFAIQDYNSNRFQLARERLELVLRRQPGNVKVIYYLQHLSIRLQQPNTTYQMCDWMYEVTNFLNFQTKKTLRAVSEQNAVLAAALDGDPDELWRRTIRAKQR